MKIEHFPITSISFTYMTYDEALYDSLKRIGLNFPIRVHRCATGYQCSDGKKRLSAIQDILKETSDHPKFKTIPVILEEGARTAAPYRLHNHH